MNKLFALILSLCLLCGSAALAENELKWEDIVPTLESAGITGDFYTFDAISVAVFIPTGMQPAELPDDSYIGYFTAEDGSAVAVCYVNANGMDLDTYAEKLTEVGATGIEKGTLNGLPCVSYEVPENKTMNVAFTTMAGYLLEVVCGPVSTDDEKLGASAILASVQPYEAAE